MIPWWAPQIGDAELAHVIDVLESGYVNDGEITRQFERRLAELLEVKHAVAVTSGTAALFLALTAAGIKQGDEVLVPDMTFIATANAVSLTGALPVLVDVDPDTLTIDITKAKLTRRTRAIVPVHVSGRAAPMAQILRFARQYNLSVIEDAAEALLSRHNGQCLGTLGQAGCFSFSPNKTITTGQGGLVVCNHDTLHERLRELKDQGRRSQGTGGDDTHHALGYNFKLTNLQAALGLGQIERLEERTKKQIAIRRMYAEGLDDVKDIRLLPFNLDSGETPQWTDAICDRRDELVAHLSAHGIQTRNFWHPLHTQAPYRLADDNFPVSAAMCKKALWLPSSFTMTNEDVQLVCEQIAKCLRSVAPSHDQRDLVDRDPRLTHVNPDHDTAVRAVHQKNRILDRRRRADRARRLPDHD